VENRDSYLAYDVNSGLVLQDLGRHTPDRYLFSSRPAEVFVRGVRGHEQRHTWQGRTSLHLVLPVWHWVHARLTDGAFADRTVSPAPADWMVIYTHVYARFH
jgi:hypothetical protein